MKSCMGEVCNCFGDSTEEGWAVFPSHGEYKWDWTVPGLVENARANFGTSTGARLTR